ncbi:hypothetical protein YTPLAS72_06910 [Nitrospira sp.]|nr:hypothetical protein YTPLAS72_06910 [Nitrospira sp.]
MLSVGSQEGSFDGPGFCQYGSGSGFLGNGPYLTASRISFNDLEALMNVAFEAKEWITAHTLKR